MESLGRALAAGAGSAMVAMALVLAFRAEEVVSFVHFGIAACVASTLAGSVESTRAVVALAGAVAVSWAMRRFVYKRLARSPRAVGTLAGMLAMQIVLAARMWWSGPPGDTRLAPPAWYAVALGAAVLAIATPLLTRGLTGAAAATAAGVLAAGAGLYCAMLFPSGSGPLSGATVAEFPMAAMATAMVAAAMAGFRDAGIAVLSAFALNVALAASVGEFGSAHPYLLALMPLLSAALLLRPKPPAPPAMDGPGPDPAWPPTIASAIKDMRSRLVLAYAVGVPVLALAAGRRPIAELAGYCLVGLSLMMLMGWIGQVTLGQLGFAALGAWITLASGLPPPLGILLGALAATILSPLVAFTAIRHSGVPAPVTSLAWGVFAYTLFTSPELLGWQRLLSPQTGPLQAVPSGRPDFVLGFAVVTCLAAVAVIGRTRFGRVLAAARLDPGIARRAGLVLPRARLTALLLTGFVAATGGGLLATAQDGLLISGYATDSGVRLVTSTGTGGIGGIAGPVAGAVVFGAVIVSVAAPAMRFLATGVLGLAVLLFEPGGLAALLRRAAGRPHRAARDVLAPLRPTALIMMFAGSARRRSRP